MIEDFHEIKTFSGAAAKKVQRIERYFQERTEKGTQGKIWCASLQPAQYQSTWPYFQSLFFLKDQCLGRASSGKMTQCSHSRNLREFDTESIGTEGSLLSQEDDREWSQSTPSTPSSSSQAWQTSSFTKKRASTESLQQQMLEIEREKLKALTKPDDEDEVKLFCLSMVPKIKKLSHDKQSLFCLKVQEMLHNFLYPPMCPTRLPYVHSSTVNSIPFNSPDQAAQYESQQFKYYEQ